MPTWKEKLPDGRTLWHIDPDDALAVSMLGDGDEQPELSQEDFAELSGELKNIRDEEPPDAGETS